jgi:DNA-binding MarR family transcriptional regulator
MKLNQIIELNHSLEHAGITFSQLVALTAIKENPGLRAGALGQMIGSTSANATGFINRFNNNGWVKLTNDANDRRVVMLQLTAKGEKVLEKMTEQRPEKAKKTPAKSKKETPAAETKEETVNA